jgi:thymidylate kinase
VSLHAAIIGVDGSGKSTCFRGVLKILAETNDVMGIGDKVYLGSKGRGVAVHDKTRWARPKSRFRSAAKTVNNPLLYEITKLAELVCWSRIHTQIVEHYKPDVILGDGAPLINIAGWGVRYHPDFFHRSHCAKALLYLSGTRKVPAGEALFYMKNIPEILLLNWSGIAPFPIPHLTFFLHVTPSVAIQRIGGRGEDIQAHETSSFLDRLQKGYELVCDILESDFRRRVCKVPVDDLSPDETIDRITRTVRKEVKARAVQDP